MPRHQPIGHCGLVENAGAKWNGLFPDEPRGENQKVRMRGDLPNGRDAQRIAYAGLRSRQTGCCESLTDSLNLPALEDRFRDRENCIPGRH